MSQLYSGSTHAEIHAAYAVLLAASGVRLRLKAPVDGARDANGRPAGSLTFNDGNCMNVALNRPGFDDTGHSVTVNVGDEFVVDPVTAAILLADPNVEEVEP